VPLPWNRSRRCNFVCLTARRARQRLWIAGVLVLLLGAHGPSIWAAAPSGLATPELPSGADRKTDLDDGNPPQAAHWAFRPIARPQVPRVKNTKWVRNPIDAFVLAKLESKDISPSPEAGRGQLIRRLKLDLLGLPPTPDEVDAFLADNRPGAYERRVDAYLASPHYGERWGRHWLDLARYADSAGYEMDYPRSAWRYRDWVIDAFNQDMPFDQFAIEQLAGDLLPGAALGQRIATAFHANNMLDAGQRWESIIDRANTTGVVFLGLTVGCAQCHNHKTDPISNREYYQWYAFFNEAETTNLDVATPQENEKRQALEARLHALEIQLAERESALTNSLPAWEANLDDGQLAKLPFTARQALETPPEKRSEDEKKTITDARLGLDKQRVDLANSIGEIKGQIASLPIVPILVDSPRQTHIFIRGNPDQPGDPVSPDVPAFLPPIPKADHLTRLDLAWWLVAPENPLTFRVEMNRVWMRYFGSGLVETENDFGVHTPPPTHPELLDWLACEFRTRGRSLKAMQRLIVSSATYRQSSMNRPDLENQDPRNHLLARQQRIRLEAEVIHDEALAVSGLLSARIGGPSVFPYQPPGILDGRATKAEWVVSQGEDQYRRGIYTWFWRLTPHPFPTLFDAPDAIATCTRRGRSNTPVQALTLLNDPAFVECARALTARALRENPRADAEAIRQIIRRCLGREPKPAEQELLSRLILEEMAAYSTAPERAKSVAANACPPEVAVSRFATWMAVSRAVLNLDEFMTRE